MTDDVDEISVSNVDSKKGKKELKKKYFYREKVFNWSYWSSLGPSDLTQRMIALLVFLFNSPSLDCTRDRFYTLFFTLSLSSFVVLRRRHVRSMLNPSGNFNQRVWEPTEQQREANWVLSEAEKRKKSAHLHKLLNRQRERTRVILSLKQSSPLRSKNREFLFCKIIKKKLFCVIKMQTDLWVTVKKGFEFNRRDIKKRKKKDLQANAAQ